jgi:hypothetical protein
MRVSTFVRIPTNVRLSTIVLDAVTRPGTIAATIEGRLQRVTR